MSDERRYDDDEVREIFARATDPPRSRSGGGDALPPAHREGLSLAELQDIGAEAGIDPSLVARAAATLDASDTAVPVLRQMGVPISVGRVVDLPARLSEEDWDRLVVRVRDLFHARGTVLREGSLRSWSNGNLQVLMEPTRTGYRLRMRSLSADIRGRLTAAGGMVAASLLVVLMGLFTGAAFTQLAPGIFFMVAVGLAMGGTGLAKSRTWRAERDAQFEEIGAMAWELAEARRLVESDEG